MRSAGDGNLITSVDASRESFGDLWVAERRVQEVAALLRMQAADRRLPRTGTVEDFAYLDAVADELAAGRLDARDDEIETA